MKNELVRKPKENSNGSFDCEIYHIQHGWIPFTAQSDDPEQHGRDIYALISNGEAGDIEPYTPPSAESVFAEEKTARLKVCDEFANQPLKYNALSDQQKTELQDYYNALNALQFGNEWPVKPEFLN